MNTYPLNRTIGIVALSLPTEDARAARVRKAIASLEKNGYKLRIGEGVFAKQGYRSSGIRERVADLQRMFEDENITCILNTTGGYNSNEILEYIDMDCIRKNPKWFVGYSDITALNLGLYACTGLKTVQGPMLVDIADDPSALRRLFADLQIGQLSFSTPKRIWEWDSLNVRSCPPLSTLPNKRDLAEGPLIAGNLSTFVLLLGTPYVPNCTGTILFLEYDRCEDKGLASVQRMLWQLRQSGQFDKIGGLVFGLLPAIVQQEETQEWGIGNILQEVTDGYSFPVFFDAPFGHLYPSWSLINGKIVRLESGKCLTVPDRYSA